MRGDCCEARVRVKVERVYRVRSTLENWKRMKKEIKVAMLVNELQVQHTLVYNNSRSKFSSITYKYSEAQTGLWTG